MVSGDTAIGYGIMAHGVVAGLALRHAVREIRANRWLQPEDPWGLSPYPPMFGRRLKYGQVALALAGVWYTGQWTFLIGGLAVLVIHAVLVRVLILLGIMCNQDQKPGPRGRGRGKPD